MIGLIINGRDAKTMGIYMGKSFISTLDGFTSIKPLIEESSRLEHGRKVIMKNIRKEKRELTLPFVIIGRNKADFRAKRDAFEQLVTTEGQIALEVPEIAEGRVYHLTYSGSSAYTAATNRLSCTVSLKFTEDNPEERS